VSLRVLHQIGDFGVDGVRATGNDTTYLLVAESDPELPDVRIERWNGSTFRPVLRTSRVCVDGDGDERVFRVPAGVRVDRDRRTGGGRGGLRTDGGQSAATTARTLTVGDRVRVAGEEHDSMFATVERIDDSPPVASELFEGARHVFLDADGERIRVLIYQTATNDDAIHLATPDAGLDGTLAAKVPARGSNAWNARSYDRRDGVARVCSVFAVSILSFVGAFMTIMTARIVTRLFTMHR